MKKDEYRTTKMNGKKYVNVEKCGEIVNVEKCGEMERKRNKKTKKLCGGDKKVQKPKIFNGHKSKKKKKEKEKA